MRFRETGEVCTSVLFICTCTTKGIIILKHVTLPHGKGNGRSLPDDSEITATVVLPRQSGSQVFESFVTHQPNVDNGRINPCCSCA